METYNTKMNRPTMFEPEPTYHNGFVWRLWNEDPKGPNELLYEAVINENLESMKKALAMGADANRRMKNRPLFHYAIETCNPAILDAFLQAGVDVDVVDEYKRTALHMCAEHPDYLATAHWLLEIGGADTNVRDAYSHTPMHIALERGNHAMKTLLENMAA